MRLMAPCLSLLLQTVLAVAVPDLTGMIDVRAVLMAWHKETQLVLMFQACDTDFNGNISHRELRLVSAELCRAGPCHGSAA